MYTYISPPYTYSHIYVGIYLYISPHSCIDNLQAGVRKRAALLSVSISTRGTSCRYMQKYKYLCKYLCILVYMCIKIYIYIDRYK